MKPFISFDKEPLFVITVGNDNFGRPFNSMREMYQWARFLLVMYPHAVVKSFTVYHGRLIEIDPVALIL